LFGGNRKITIGKWSLPWRSLSISHLACGARVAEQSERSICVYVLCVEKCVGDLSFSKISCVLSINCCIDFPRELVFGEPQAGCHPLKSPRISKGV